MPALPDPEPGPSPPCLRAEAWAPVPGLVHGFFGRHGGISRGALASLNVSDRVGDDPAAVAANWERIRAATPLSIARMQQVHGTRVAPVRDAGATVGPADGMVTATPSVGLAVLTADCVPLLFAAPAVHIAMAVHAGWRGTLAGIAAAALDEAQRAFGVGPADWLVALGPAIGGCCYEVEAAIGRELTDRWGAMPDAWQPGPTRGQLDLREANRRILLAQGVPAERIAGVGPCTACRSDDYFSHRRSGGCAGRQLSLVGWADGPGR